MRMTGLALAAAGCFAVTSAQAQLSGQIASSEEGAMEGVVVSAKADASTITVSVVSDDKGHYAFPAGRLAPGHYTLSIRAVGYRARRRRRRRRSAAGAPTSSSRRPRSSRRQLTNAEWLMSIPGSDEQKKFLLNCAGCHTLQRIVSSTHNAAEFAQVIDRMAGYYPGSTPIHPQHLVGDFRRNIGHGANVDAIAKYLASINLSSSPTWEYPLKTMPRPTGKATHVVVTEYDAAAPDDRAA